MPRTIIVTESTARADYRAAVRARRLFRELMGVEDGTREFERLERKTRDALGRIVALMRRRW